MDEPRQTIAQLIWACVLGLITGAIAKRKGRSFGGYWAFGTLMFLVALPYVLLMRPKLLLLSEPVRKSDKGPLG